MKQFEYNTLYNKHYGDAQGLVLKEDLQKLGKDGWQLIISREAPDGTLFIFIREVEKKK